MKTRVLSIIEAKNGTSQMRLESPEGEEILVGFYDTMPLHEEEAYRQAVETITDNFYFLGESNYFNYLSHELIVNGYGEPLYAGIGRNIERDRIGRRIKELREEQNMDAKTLANKAGVTPANMSRMEQGKYSPGLDVICRIANALGMQLDFVKKTTIQKKEIL